MVNRNQLLGEKLTYNWTLTRVTVSQTYHDILVWEIGREDLLKFRIGRTKGSYKIVQFPSQTYVTHRETPINTLAMISVIVYIIGQGHGSSELKLQRCYITMICSPFKHARASSITISTTIEAEESFNHLPSPCILINKY